MVPYKNIVLNLTTDKEKKYNALHYRNMVIKYSKEMALSIRLKYGNELTTEIWYRTILQKCYTELHYK